MEQIYWVELDLVIFAKNWFELLINISIVVVNILFCCSINADQYYVPNTRCIFCPNVKQSGDVFCLILVLTH